MSEHPPVPCPDCKGPVRFREDWRSESFLCDQCGAGFAMPHGWTEKNYTDLWREWTRGMAVVPLPEPTETPNGYPAWEVTSRDGPYCCVEPDQDEEGTFLHVRAPEKPTVEQAREFFAAGLSACDNADRVIAEFLARPKDRAEQLAAEQAKAVKDA